MLRKLESRGVRVREETKAALQIENLLISTVTKVYIVRERIIKAITGNGLTKLEWLETKRYKQEPDDS